MPKSAPMRMRLDEAISRRRSVRKFTGDPIGLDDLAALVRSATGQTGEAIVLLSDVAATPRVYQLRSVPSAGGLYPVELLVVAQNITGLERRLYSYDVRSDRLREFALTKGKTIGAVTNCFGVEEVDISLSRAALVILFIGYPWRSMRKYGNKGLRFVLQEVGGISQNLSLACVALGLGSVDCATIYEDEVQAVLGLDGRSAVLMHTVIVGHPA